MSTDEQTTDPTDLTEQPEVTEQPDQTEQPDKAGKEAAKYRRRLREAETERDSAREQMDALRRQVAESASGLDKPAALWAAGVSLDDLFTEQGTLDHDAIAAAVETVRETLGTQSKPTTPKPDLTQGSQGTAARPSDPWQDAFTPRS